MIVALFLTAQTASAACDLVTDRTPCQGKEGEALKPYGNQNPTFETTKDKTPEACLKSAEAASKIVRKKLLAAKTVTAKFDNKVLGSPKDTSDCK
jgi:hypothetical protein